ncbi:MAG: putative ABC exporter domain-containing protein [Sphaerochaetaceae bacterium]|nr:putative ABC exporter domain-containing protein [Sphaerochaetaceae bacterium]
MKRFPLAYLLLTRLKNSLLGLIRKPAGIVCMLFMTAALVMVIRSGNESSYGETYRDIRELQAGASILFCFLFFTLSANGFSNGGSIFTLSDVNFLFNAPLSSTRILVYGLFQQIARNLLLGIFLLFQYSWIHGVYGAGYGLILSSLACYAMVIFLGQLAAMSIYAFSQRGEGIAMAIKAFYGVLLAAYVLPLLFALTQGGDLLESGVSVLSGPLSWFPVAGWLSSAAFGSHLAFSLLLCLAFIAVLIFLLMAFDPDYYEDVLLTAETANSQAVASKEGRMVESAPKHIKLGKVGLEHGKGSSAIYFKHRIEDRRAKASFIGIGELAMMIGSLAFAYIMRGEGILPGLLFGAYMQVFSVILGRFNKEISKPLVYLIPSRAYSKLLFTIASSLETYAKEAVLYAAGFTFIFKGGIGFFLSCLLARFSFAMLILSIHIIMQRLFGALNSKVLTITLYFLFFILMAAIGVVAAFLLVKDPSLPVFMLVEGLCNAMVALLALLLCRNVLSTAELNS